MAERTINDLRQKQALPLNVKVLMTKQRIRDWVNEFGEDGVYISFSGGKDSTVLLDIVRSMYPSIPAVFVDTGLEYPEIREFVKSFENVVWLKPKKTFKQVIEEYGYPFISKEVSGCVSESYMFIEKAYQSLDEETRSSLMSEGINHGADRLSNRLLFCEKIVEKQINVDVGKTYEFGNPVRLLQLFGKCPHREKGVTTGEYSQMYNKEKWKFLLDAPFDVSNQCCNVMKKNPIKKYAKESGRHPITGQIAEESLLRTANWLKKGCNQFNSNRPMSNPISFWTNQDVLLYIKQNNLPICSVYGDIIEDTEIDGQMSLFDYIDSDAPKLKTSGCDRTGCMFCGYGCHLEKGEGRFERMKRTHPKQYDYIMRPREQGGLDYKNVIDWINKNGNLKIKY